MLDFLLPENTWCPPELEVETVQECYKQIDAEEFEDRDFLIICKIKPYIDSVLVHVSDKADEEPAYIKRFTFCDGFVWDSETEKIFVARCLNNPECGYPYAQIDDIYGIYTAKYPDWKLNRYCTKPFRLLDHIYHCMRKGSAKEILYKAGLDELAVKVEEIDELNLLSSKPSDIYEGVSMRVLRALNCNEGAMLLSQAYNRNFLKELQMKFPEIFKKD